MEVGRLYSLIVENEEREVIFAGCKEKIATFIDLNTKKLYSIKRGFLRCVVFNKPKVKLLNGEIRICWQHIATPRDKGTIIKKKQYTEELLSVIKREIETRTIDLYIDNRLFYKATDLRSLAEVVLEFKSTVSEMEVAIPVNISRKSLIEEIDKLDIYNNCPDDESFIQKKNLKLLLENSTAK